MWPNSGLPGPPVAIGVVTAAMIRLGSRAERAARQVCFGADRLESGGQERADAGQIAGRPLGGYPGRVRVDEDDRVGGEADDTGIPVPRLRQDRDSPSAGGNRPAATSRKRADGASRPSASPTDSPAS